MGRRERERERERERRGERGEREGGRESSSIIMNSKLHMSMSTQCTETFLYVCVHICSMCTCVHTMCVAVDRSSSPPTNGTLATLGIRVNGSP